MLRFQSHPDKVFTAILKDSIELTIDEIIDTIRMAESQEETNEHLKSLLPNANLCCQMQVKYSMPKQP
jgi:hypothetical protein